MAPLNILQLTPASLTPPPAALAEARKKKQNRIQWIGYFLAMVTYCFAELDYGVSWLLGFTLANTLGYRLAPRTPEKFVTWLNRQMLPYALCYAFIYQPLMLLRAWLPGRYALAYVICSLGLAVALEKRYGYLLEEPKPPSAPGRAVGAVHNI